MKFIRQLIHPITFTLAGLLRAIAAALLIAMVALLATAAPAAALSLADPPPAAAVFEIPTLPLGIVALVSFLSPYAIAIINQSFWSAKVKRAVAILISLAVTALAMVVYYSASGEPIPQWWFLLLLGLATSQMSYGLLTKYLGADWLEQRTTATE